VTGIDWVAWHRRYGATGPLSRRLAIVQAHVERVLAEGGPVRLLSLCSGDGRDVIGAMTRLGRGGGVRGRLIEINPELANGARVGLAEAGIQGVDIVEADAGLTTSLAGAVPADLVLLCGIFGNVTDDDIRRTVEALPSLCAPRARVIWTRHRRAPDLTPTIQAWFEASGFEHEAFDPVPDSSGCVGVERFVGRPQPFQPDLRLFRFRDTSGDWLNDLEPAAPDVVAVFRNVEAGKPITVRREVRRRTTLGSAPAIVPQLAAIADAFDILIAALPDRAFAAPGGEGDWNVAQAIGHTAHARAGLTLAGALAASGRWPEAAPAVVPGIPGAADANRDELRRRIAISQKSIERAARTIEGHETDPCPLEHPTVGRLRCGEWLLFAGVHDLMHLEQLHGIDARLSG
jgi:DinB superfamily